MSKANDVQYPHLNHAIRLFFLAKGGVVDVMEADEFISTSAAAANHAEVEAQAALYNDDLLHLCGADGVDGWDAYQIQEYPTLFMVIEELEESL